MDETSSLLQAFVVLLVGTQSSLLLQKLKRRKYNERHGVLTRRNVISPFSSPWAVVRSQMDDRALIMTTGLNRDGFERLLGVFGPLWTGHSPLCRGYNTVSGIRPIRSKRGRPRSLDPAGGLAIVLHFMRTTATISQLCLVFGTVPSVTSLWIQFGLIILLHTLRKEIQARVHWPKNAQEVAMFARVIATRCPHLLNCWGMLDGLNLRCLNSTDPERQNASYNGWLHGCFCSSLIVFTPDGCICWFITNAPGSWHDSQMAIAGGLYQKLAHERFAGFVLSGDSAFPRTDANSLCPGRILRCRKANEPEPDCPIERARENEARSVRQGNYG